MHRDMYMQDNILLVKKSVVSNANLRRVVISRERKRTRR